MKPSEAVKMTKALYKGISSWETEKDDPIRKLSKDKKKEIEECYGETRPSGVTTIINKLKIDKDDVFFDLGCGGGKVVTQFYFQTPAKSCNGVEYSTTRYKNAHFIKALVLSGKTKLPNKSLNFFNESFLDTDLSKGTIFYIANTLFSQKLNKKIWDKIYKNKNLKAIIALHGMPDTCDKSKVIDEKYFSVPCTWTNSCCYIYYFK
jgi:hypothetical protein